MIADELTKPMGPTQIIQEICELIGNDHHQWNELNDEFIEG